MEACRRPDRVGLQELARFVLEEHVGCRDRAKLVPGFRGQLNPGELDIREHDEIEHAVPHVEIWWT